MRAVAVLAVMAFHLDPAYCPGGFTGVDIFFVISGFVVTRSVTERRSSGFAELIVAFYERRMRRILPALLVMLLLTSLATVAFVPEAWLGRSNRSTAFWASFGASNILLATRGQDYFDSAADYNPFLHTWSLGVEEQFYLLFPFLIVLCQTAGHQGRRRIGLALLALLVTSSLAWCAYATGRPPTAAYFQMPGRFWELGLGVFVALTRYRWAPWLDGQNTISLCLGAVLAALPVAAGLAFADAGAFPFPWAIPPVMGTAGLLMLADTQGRALDWLALGSRPFTWIGRRSYSLYLWHWPVYALFRWTAGLDNGRWQVAAVILVIGLAALSYRWVEQPVRRSARLAHAPKPIIIASFSASIALGAALSTLVFNLAPMLSLSVTRDARTWSPFSRKIARNTCAVGSTEQRSGHILRVAFWPVDCGASLPARQLWVIGDSHAAAYIAMLGRLVAEQGVTVEIRSTEGCAVLGLRAEANEGCLEPVARVKAALLRETRPGDLVFLPSLRIDRYVDLVRENEIHESNREAEDASIAADTAYLRRLTATGASVMLEAPLPVFKAPPFRCADWFNRNNAICQAGFTIPRTEIELRRASVLAAERTISAGLPDVTIWDPLPVLCGAGDCRAIKEGKPLFFDGDHLSGYGDQLLYPSFAAAFRQCAAASHAGELHGR